MSAFDVRRCKDEFYEYRGGVKHSSGLTVELSRVEPISDVWEQRLERVHRGLTAVRGLVHAGVARQDLDQCFLAHMDRDQDQVYGSVVRHTGYDPHENITWDKLNEYDYVTLSATVADMDNNVATITDSAMPVYRSSVHEKLYGMRNTLSRIADAPGVAYNINQLDQLIMTPTVDPDKVSHTLTEIESDLARLKSA